jgi:hypothetical protein
MTKNPREIPGDFVSEHQLAENDNVAGLRTLGNLLDIEPELLTIVLFLSSAEVFAQRSRSEMEMVAQHPAAGLY